MSRKQTRVARQCESCGKTFETIPSRIEQGGGKYCSMSCYATARVGVKRGPLNWKEYPRGEKICVVCGKTFPVGPGTGHEWKQNVCSNKCQQLSRYRHGSRAKDLSIPDAAYLAGIVDGEGSILLYMRRDAVALRMHVSNTDKALLDWIADVTGVGRVFHHRNATATHAETWGWWANSEAAETVLRQIRPYLRIKAVQADLAIETQERLRDPALKAARPWQSEYRDRMRELNRRGPRE